MRAKALSNGLAWQTEKERSGDNKNQKRLMSLEATGAEIGGSVAVPEGVIFSWL